MPEQRRLRVHGHGDIEVELIIAYLTDLKHAYNSFIVFEAMIDGTRRAAREFPFFFPLGNGIGLPIYSRRMFRYLPEWPPQPAAIASLIPRSEQLTLSAVSISSPGFWEFLGSLNALEFIRKWLNDSHERRKDRDYRESAERRKLNAENFQRETQAIAERVRLARELGATDRDLAPLLNELIFKPLGALGQYQDRGVIEHAEILPPAETAGREDER